MENEVRTLRGVLRRMAFAAPGVRRVGGEGMNFPALQAAAEREGLEFVEADAEAWLVWCPGESCSRAAPCGKPPRVVAVIATSVEPAPLPGLASAQSARICGTLREWVARWPLAKLISPFLASDAVGARTCTVRLPGNTEFIFTSDPHPAPQGGTGEWAKEQLVTAFGSGLFPLMPATLASALMLPPALVVRELAGAAAFTLVALIVALLATLASVALEQWASRRFMAEDPREFVLDEVAGMALAWAFVPPDSGWPFVILAFLLFRVFDIFKWGVSWVEHLPIPGKIVWDDLLAGLYAGLACLALATLWR